MVGAVLAEGTAAGTDISNTATATYTDGNGNPFDATSNTVVIKVAEIAGLTAVASPVIDVDGGAIEAGDDLIYTFTVTNVGNAVTDISVPGISGFRLQNFAPSATSPVGICSRWDNTYWHRTARRQHSSAASRLKMRVGKSVVISEIG